MTRHTDYFEHGSTSAGNIEGVVYGEDVAPYLKPEIQTYPGAYQPVITYPLEENLAQYRDEGIRRSPWIPSPSRTNEEGHMTHGRRLLNAATVAVALTASLALGGCMNPDTEGTSEAEERSAAHGRLIESDLPLLARAAGWDSITTLSEKSCLGTPDPEEASRQTKWIGSRSAEMDEAEALEVADQVSSTAEDLGWSAQQGAGPHGDRVYGATKDDLTLVVSHKTSGGANTLTIAVHSPCLDMPAGHTMTRSELDSMYGSSDPLYPNDDRSKFTNGEAKPLPEPTGD